MISLLIQLMARYKADDIVDAENAIELRRWRENNGPTRQHIESTPKGKIMDIPRDVMEKIKRKAKNEWPDDFGMQKHVIDTQVQAYTSLVNYKRSDVPPQVLDRIKSKAKSEWPDDFGMQKHVIDTQVQAYTSLVNYKRSDVPPQVLDRIKSKAKSEWPDDFGMQKHVIDTQLKAYLQLHSM